MVRPTFMFLFVTCVFAASFDSPCRTAEYAPDIAAASSEGEVAITMFQLPDGMEARLFAAEPMVANPVAFTIDRHGRFFVCETFRQQKGVEDNRYHMDWLEDDLAAQTVEDRLAYFKKHLGDKVNDYTLHHDRIRLIEDRDGDGRADQATVFADGFNGILDGTGGGVLMREGDVFYTCIPKLWRLRDNDGDGKADERNALHHGYGVRVAFRGHDSHGLTMGPDGRLYFSIGDRGYNVVTQEGKRLARPDTGAVFRCDLDGSNLEVFAYGLRNPQELAFDNFGNLFTGDNNSDGGDQARWVYVTRGSDSGWRMYYQYLADRGPWNREKLWHPHHDGQAAYITPPVANIADGPSGLVHYPGVGLSPHYADHFFLCDFRGEAGQSGVRSFAVRPQGASFELVDAQKFVWSILGTDIAFGFDGRFYISDWVHGWDGLNKGRIYSFRDTAHAADAVQTRTAALMGEGFRSIDIDRLVELLAHVDQRVRLESQFELARRLAHNRLLRVAMNGDDQLARIHALWGLGQLGRTNAGRLLDVVPLLQTPDAEVRAQAAKILGENYLRQAEQPLRRMLRDPSPRARFFAAQTLAAYADQLSDKASCARTIAARLHHDQDDPLLFHMYAYALSRMLNADELLNLAHQQQNARLSVAVALRRQRSPLIAQLLEESDQVALEAARAIHDEPIVAALPALAAVRHQAWSKNEAADPLLRRVINANFIVGTRESATRVAEMAADPALHHEIRTEAIWALQNWHAPPNLDRVLGAYRPIQRRDAIEMAAIVQPFLADIVKGPRTVMLAAVDLMGSVGVRGAADLLFAIATNDQREAAVRGTAIVALMTLGDPRLPDVIQHGLRDASAEVRMKSRVALAEYDPDRIVDALKQALEHGEVREQQQALDMLGSCNAAEADDVLETWLDRLIAGQVARAIQLDLLKAAQSKGRSKLAAKIAAYHAARPIDDPLAEYTECLEGGDASRGEAIFASRAELSCRRCHHIEAGFKSVGPNLWKIGAEKDRRYLLESIVDPNKQIAKGFETVVVIDDNGLTKTGTVLAETNQLLQLMTATGDVVSIPQDEIEERTGGQSAMPADLVKQLSKSDLRDLVEYLVTLRGS